MNEEILRILGIEGPPDPETPGVRSWRRRIALAGLLGCLGMALFFLFKPESGPIAATWQAEDGVRTYGPRGVSVYRFYCVWPAARRKAVAEGEGAAQMMMILGGSTQLPLPRLQDRIAGNLRTALFFCLIGPAGFFVTRMVRVSGRHCETVDARSGL